MKIFNSVNSYFVIESLEKGGIGVLPTDTIYGLACSAFDRDAVEKIYDLKKRNKNKPPVILIGSVDDLKKMDIEVSEEIVRKIMKEFWPGKVSIILPLFCPSDNRELGEVSKFDYLHRGLKTLAIRFPDKPELIELLKKTGPLVTSSVNLEGKMPAKNIKEAMSYFGEKVDFYVDEGEIGSTPSAIIALKDGEIIKIR